MSENTFDLAEFTIMDGFDDLLDNLAASYGLNEDIAFLSIENENQQADSANVITPGIFDEKSSSPPNSKLHFQAIPKAEWTSRFKALANLCNVMKSADKLEEYFDSLKTESKFLEQKVWLHYIRNHFDFLEVYQREDMLVLIKRAWLYLRPPPKDPLQHSISSTKLKTSTMKHEAKRPLATDEPSDDDLLSSNSSTPSEEDEWQPPPISIDQPQHLGVKWV